VRVVGVFPADTHPPIVYPAALTAAAGSAAAGGFLEFLGSPEAKPLFDRHGFAALK